MNQVSNSTIQRYIANLKRSWINEKNSPELLPYENSIDIIRPMILYQQNRIDQAELYASDNADKNQLLAEEYKLQYPILQLGLDRIKYILASYLRIRINKIDNNVMYYLSNANALENLSQNEKNYALKYVDLLGDSFNEAFINHIPEKLSNLTEDGMSKLSLFSSFFICS